MSLLQSRQSSATYDFTGPSTVALLRNAALVLEQMDSAEYVSGISFDTDVTHMTIGGNRTRTVSRQVLTVEVTG